MAGIPLIDVAGLGSPDADERIAVELRQAYGEWGFGYIVNTPVDLALLDAVSAGLPVVLSDIPQNVEVMGDAARYCGPDDVACWQRCLTELVRDPEALAGLRAACAAHDIGTVDGMVDAYLRLVDGR